MQTKPSPAVAAFLDTLARDRASAILRTDRADAAGPAMEAAVRGGFRIVEFTLTTPGAFELIAEFSRRDGLIVGAGTVLDVKQAERAVEAGAQFLVSPIVDEEVITAAQRLDAACMPGCQTPTEMARAYRAGAPLQKLFPAAAGGANYVRACLGPLPMLRIVPTNGVDEHGVENYFQAGAFAVGFVAPLFEPAAVQQGDWDRIEERARTLRTAVDRARSHSL